MHRNAVAYRFGEKYDTNSLSAVPLFCFSEMEAVMNPVLSAETRMLARA